MSAQRLDPGEARRDVDSGDALLVCAYDDEEKCRNYASTNTLLLSELSAKEKTLPKDRKIVFYCAWPQEATSARRAEEYQAKGFTNVWAVRGGFDALR